MPKALRGKLEKKQTRHQKKTPIQNVSKTFRILFQRDIKMLSEKLMEYSQNYSIMVGVVSAQNGCQNRRNF